MNLILNNSEITIKRISNYLLYSPSEIVKINVPISRIESQNRDIENPNHPDYIEALEVFTLEKSEFIFNKIVSNITLVNKNSLETKQWKMFYKKLSIVSELKESEEFYYIKYFLINDLTTKNKIINECCLTESRVSGYFNMISVTKFGESLHDINLRHTINTGIEYEHIQIGNDILVNPIDEWLTCSESNMDWHKWLNNEYSLETMALTIALKRLNKLVNVHSEDEQQTQIERKNK